MESGWKALVIFGLVLVLLTLLSSPNVTVKESPDNDAEICSGLYDIDC